MSIALWWGIAVVVLVIVEMLTMEFTCLSLAIGCALGAAAAGLGLPQAVQFIAAVAGAVAGLGMLAPRLRHRLAPGDTATDLEAIAGSEGVVVEAIAPPAQGKVKLNGVVWQATSSQPIPAGATVMIAEVEGACLRVLTQGAILPTARTAEAEPGPEPHRPHPQQDMLSN